MVTFEEPLGLGLNVREEGIAVPDEFPDSRQRGPIRGNPILQVNKDHGSCGDIVVLDEMLILGLVDVDRAPDEISLGQRFGELNLQGFEGVGLDGATGLAPSRTMKIVSNDLIVADCISLTRLHLDGFFRYRCVRDRFCAHLGNHQVPDTHTHEQQESDSSDLFQAHDRTFPRRGNPDGSPLFGS
jgi:hypothetical protein